MNLEPLGDRIVVKPTAKEETTKGGIILPDTVKEKPQEGEVIAVGPGRMTEEGKRITLGVKKGDTVVYPRYSGTELKIDGEEYLIMRESEILAKRG